MVAEPPRYDLMGVRVDGVRFSEVLDLISEYILEGAPRHIVTLGTEMAMAAYKDPELARIIQESSLVTPDSVGIIWGAQKLGYHLPERVCGVDLLCEVVRLSSTMDWPFFLLGASPGVAKEAAESLKRRFGKISLAGTYHGFFKDPEEPIASISQAAPRVLFVGLGIPKQEKWIHKYKDLLGVPVLIGVGGSFDVISGRLARAPDWMLEFEIEWLYRLIQEPRRAGRMLALLYFAIKILWHKWSRGSSFLFLWKQSSSFLIEELLTELSSAELSYSMNSIREEFYLFNGDGTTRE